MSDAILFGLIFATFVVLSTNLASGPSGSELSSFPNLSAHTALVPTSTLTIAFAHTSARQLASGAAALWLVATLMLGAAFLALELRELSGLIAQVAGPDRSGYLSAFFRLVGIHGLRVAGGFVWAATLIVQLVTQGPNSRVLSRLSRLTLFWHFLDIVWIGVFSVGYLPELV